jgi:hypothetical protein
MFAREYIRREKTYDPEKDGGADMRSSDGSGCPSVAACN